ncbi:SPFH domain-containing protein [Streptomyces sp. RB6PN25]|uniref:SPFH domain-containing protein n=1 Tax=Streptomyces humicola TaxID=2953240 RepID=A0ABT1PN30_9ACTN|nr:flotillin family protein [Streptomyces humicola]MCQ4079084.1 SPFH domain-containing protein [Streptomyces humicola]
MLFWHVPAPNEAMLISGSKRPAHDTQFRIVTGHGSFVLPIKQKARMLSLALREAEIVEDCVTQQGIRLNVRAVAAFKVGDDSVSIANAARRFLTEQERMEELSGRIFAGHLRSIVGGLTVEQIIRERDRVAQEVKEASHTEMEKLGIVVDALQIQEISDATGYINNLAAPHAAAVASQARIAQAKADQEAAEREQQAAALKAEYERDTAIKRAGFLAETEQSNARAAQAGPLAEARASQEVIEEQTALAQRQAALAAQRLEAEVRRPADAEAYRQRTLAEAQRDRTKFEADGRAYTERAIAQAQADANTARAASLRDGNQELIAANRVVENLPVLTEAAARGIAGSRLTILNGTEGVNEVASGVVAQGLAVLETLRNSTLAPSMDGAVSAPAPAASAPREA